MRSLALAPALVLALALPLTVACRPQATTSADGATTYRVTGALVESACAPGLEPIDPLEFDAEVRSTGSIVYWRLGHGPWIPGSLAADGTFRLSTRAEVEAIPAYAGTDPDFDPPRPGCWLYQTETITGRFHAPPEADAGPGTDAGPSADAGPERADAGSPRGDGGATLRDAGPPDPTSIGALEAENTIEISIVAGSACDPLLLSNGGAFPALPCRARYELRGTAARLVD